MKACYFAGLMTDEGATSIVMLVRICPSGRLSRGTTKLVYALLLKYSYSTIGDDVICFIV